MSSNILTRRLKDEMKKQNWTGRKLSVQANLSYNAIHYILSGKNKSTNFEVVNAIASVLKVSPFYLLDENYKKTGNSVAKEVAEPKILPKNSEQEMPYDGELYREIMLVVEELLTAKNELSTSRIEHFTHYVYSQIKKNSATTKEKNQKKNIKSYAEGIIDYALNRIN
ncbi:MAG: helix-turn-helix domain-containing protein [Pseudomonadota bacterium]